MTIVNIKRIPRRHRIIVRCLAVVVLLAPFAWFFLWVFPDVGFGPPGPLILLIPVVVGSWAWLSVTYLGQGFCIHLAERRKPVFDDDRRQLRLHAEPPIPYAIIEEVGIIHPPSEPQPALWQVGG